MSMSFASGDKDVALMTGTCGDLLRAAAAEVPDRLALVEGISGDAARRWTYRELLDAAEHVAGGLLALFAPGERLGIWAASVPEWEILQFASALAGVTVVTLNPVYRADELKFVLAASRCAGIIVADEYRGQSLPDVVEQVRPDLPELREVLHLRNIDALLAAPVPATFPTVDETSPAMIQYTSGTTGAPKGALLSHVGVVNNAWLSAAGYHLDEAPVFVNPLPMFHVGGCVNNSLSVVALRGTHVLMPWWDAQLALELLERERGTYIVAVPTMFIGMLEHPDLATRDLSSMQRAVSGGTTVPPELVNRIESAFDTTYMVIFGQTETGGVVCLSSPEDTVLDKCNRSGRPIPHTEIRVVDIVTRDTVLCGEVGEFWVRGPGVMSGYFELPEATADAIDADGWLRTGDLGIMDERGYIAVTGRLKDMVIRGGENIYPREIEDALYTHSGVADAAVIGVPDERWGEELVAFIRTSGELPFDPELLDGFLRPLLAPHKIPKRWVELGAMPVTPSGKIQKFVLRDSYLVGQYPETRVTARTTVSTDR